MASLRTFQTARLLRYAAPCCTNRIFIPLSSRRFESSLPARGELDASSEVPSNTPLSPEEIQHSALIDKATSTFTPVPKRIQTGAEEYPTLPAAITSGAPLELQARAVRIYKPSKPATQSGDWQTKRWRMDWDVLGKGHRWENPLMGWQSSGDFMQGTHLTFTSKEDAISFAERQGYEYYVQEPKVRASAPKAYANNFSYSPQKLKHIRTK